MRWIAGTLDDVIVPSSFFFFFLFRARFFRVGIGTLMRRLVLFDFLWFTVAYLVPLFFR